MPIFEIECRQCGFCGEVIKLNSQKAIACPSCGSTNIHRLISATSSLTGKTSQVFPGVGDTGCCGSVPGHAGCAGPGSCCGKTG
ncbi:MAG: zinc ribbon domain-containing protein [Desulfobacteraceae bacterium]|nr:zinc ribbon domain-containing protein [Desulfobacteraceae bacterium]